MALSYNPYGINPRSDEPLSSLSDLLVNSSFIGGAGPQPQMEQRPVPSAPMPSGMSVNSVLDSYGVPPLSDMPDRVKTIPELQAEEEERIRQEEADKISMLLEAAEINNQAERKEAEERAIRDSARRAELSEAARMRRVKANELGLLNAPDTDPGILGAYKGISGTYAYSQPEEALMTPREAKLMGKMAPEVNFFEGFKSQYSKENAEYLRRIPMLGGAFGYIYDKEIEAAYERLANQDVAYGPDPENDPQYRVDVRNITKHENDANYRAAREYSEGPGGLGLFGGRSGEMLGQLLPYMTEYAMGRSLLGGAGKYGRFLGTNKKLLGGGTSSIPTRAAKGVLQSAGITGISAGRVLEQSSRYGDQYQVLENELGNLEAKLTEEGDSEALKLLKGFGSHYTDVVFELVGGAAGAISKAVMKAIPDGASRKYLEDVAKRYGASKFGKFMEVLNKYGVQGPIAEYYLEEYPVAIANVLTGLDVEAQRAGESFKDRLYDAATPSWKDEQAPALSAFALPVVSAGMMATGLQAAENARRRKIMEDADSLVTEYGIHPRRAAEISSVFESGERDRATKMLQEERIKAAKRQQIGSTLGQKEGEITPEDVQETYKALREEGVSHFEAMSEIQTQLRAAYKAEQQAYAKIAALEGDSQKTEAEAAKPGPGGRGDSTVEMLRSDYGITDTTTLEIIRRLGNAAQTESEVAEYEQQVNDYIQRTGLTPLETPEAPLAPEAVQPQQPEAQDAVQVREATQVPVGEGARGGPQVDREVREQAPAVEGKVPEAEVGGVVTQKDGSERIIVKIRPDGSPQYKTTKTSKWTDDYGKTYNEGYKAGDVVSVDDKGNLRGVSVAAWEKDANVTKADSDAGNTEFVVETLLGGDKVTIRERLKSTAQPPTPEAEVTSPTYNNLSSTDQQAVRQAVESKLKRGTPGQKVKIYRGLAPSETRDISAATIGPGDYVAKDFDKAATYAGRKNRFATGERGQIPGRVMEMEVDAGDLIDMGKGNFVYAPKGFDVVQIRGGAANRPGGLGDTLGEIEARKLLEKQTTASAKAPDVTDTTARDVETAFRGLAGGVSEAGQARVNELVKKQGYIEYANKGAADLFRKQNPDWTETIVDGKSRFSPPPTTPKAPRPQVDEGVQSEIEKIEKAIAEKETEGQVADEVVEPTTGAMGQQPGGDQGVGLEAGGAGQPGIVQPGVAPVAGVQIQEGQAGAPAQQPEPSVTPEQNRVRVIRGDQLRTVEDADSVVRRAGSEQKQHFDQVLQTAGPEAAIDYASTINAKEFEVYGERFKKVGGKWFRSLPSGRMTPVNYGWTRSGYNRPMDGRDAQIARFLDPIGHRRAVERSVDHVNALYAKSGMQVQIVDTPDKLPEVDRMPVLEKMRSEGVTPDGIYRGQDRIYVIRDFVAPDRAVAVATHELVGHGGLDAMFDGDQEAKNDFLMRVWSSMSPRMRKDALSIISRQPPTRGDQQAERQRILEATEELFATTQELRDTNPGIYRRMVSGIKEIVRKFVSSVNKQYGLNIPIPSYTEADVDAFATSLRNNVRRGRYTRTEAAATREAPTFAAPARAAAPAARVAQPVATAQPAARMAPPDRPTAATDAPTAPVPAREAPMARPATEPATEAAAATEAPVDLTITNPETIEQARATYFARRKKAVAKKEMPGGFKPYELEIGVVTRSGAVYSKNTANKPPTDHFRAFGGLAVGSAHYHKMGDNIVWTTDHIPDDEDALNNYYSRKWENDLKHSMLGDLRRFNRTNESRLSRVRDRTASATEPAPTTVQDISDVAKIENTLILAKSKNWRRGRDLKEAIQNAVKSAADAAGIDISVRSEKADEYLLNVATEDAIFALRQNANAIGWYDEKTRQALSVMSLIHPEISTDENSRFAFTWALAVTSNGMKVDKNFDLAESTYQYYKRNGSMPTNLQAGQAQAAINSSLQLFNELVKAWGIDNLRMFMQTNFTVREIGSLSKELKPDGEFVDTEVKGSAIIGPKIGNGFFSNLYGDFSPLTMDRWLIRTWGRWTGTLIKNLPEQTSKAEARLKDAVAAAGENARELSDLIGMDITSANINELAVAIKKASMDKESRAAMNMSPAGQELRKAGNSLYNYLDGQKESPSGPGERNHIRSIFAQVLSKLRENPEYADLTMADLQAVLWYAEKRVYETAKEDIIDEDVAEGYSDEEAPDYANAAASVARSKGISERKINNALNKESKDGRARRTRLQDEQVQPGKLVWEQKKAGGFTERKKRIFIGAVATQTIRANRAGDEASSWSYGRESVEDGRGVRVLKKLGVTYSGEWSPGRNLARVYRNNGISTPRFFELESGNASNASRFVELIESSRSKAGPVSAAVYVYPAEEYGAMRLFVSEDGLSGFAIKPDGDIVSVFSSGGAGRSVVELAVAVGGRKLDAFDTILPEFYNAHGFIDAARLKWDETQKPSGWNKDEFIEYNNGEPDVVFMVYDANHVSLDYKPTPRVAKSYESAVRAQSKAMRNISGRTTGTMLSRGGAAPIFYSEVERTVEDARQPSAPGAQWMAWLSKQPGIKKEELDWMGVDEWLKSQDRPVKREDLLAFIRANKVEVREVIKSAEPNIEDARRELSDLTDDGLVEYAASELDVDRGELDGLSRDEILQRIVDNIDPYEAMNLSPVKYKSYTLPGGRGYREILLTLPTPEDMPEAEFRRTYQLIDDNGDVIAQGDEAASDRWRAEDPDADIRYVPVETQRSRMQEEGTYKSPHWSERNVLATVRMNERVDANGVPVAFMEEVQSDWHQAGRKEGYATGVDTTGWGAVQNDFKNDVWDVYNAEDELVGVVSMAMAKTEDGAIEIAAKNQQRSLVPDAPFKTSWPVLAVKRMIRWAAESGYSRIAWTTGDMQTDRYDLSKQVDYIEVEYDKDQTPGYKVDAYKDGRMMSGLGVYTAEELPNVIGKDLADRVVNDERVQAGEVRKFKGDDLKVGGEGMRVFYDKILPAEINKYIKKWGVKVGKTEIDDARFGGERINPVSVHSFDITPEMRESALAGQPMFSRSRVTPDQDAEYLASVERGDAETAQRMVDEAAKAAGYTSGVVYHGTTAEPFTIFDPSRALSDTGIHFTPDIETAKRYAQEIPYTVRDAKSEKLFGVKYTFLDSDQKRRDVVDAIMRDARVVKAYLRIDRLDDSRGRSVNLSGVEGPFVGDKRITPLNEQSGFHYRVYDPRQIKSAEPITRDDQGNVIPLSQRFNVEEEDIRFSRRRDRGADFRVAEATLGAEIYGRKAGRLEGMKEGLKQGAAEAKKRADEKLAKQVKAFREEAKRRESEARIGGEIYGKKKGRAEGMREGRKAGMAEGVKKGRETAEQKAADKISSILEKQRNEAVIRAQVAETLKALPQPRRGKFITALRDAKTTKNLSRVVSRINAELQGIEKKELISEIKSLAGRFQTSPAVAVDYRVRISELMNDILTSKPTAATVAKARSLQSYIDRQTLAGNPIDIPARVMKRLRVLSGKPLQDMSIGDLASLKDELERLIMLGKSKLQRRVNLDAMEKDRDAELISNQSQGIDSRKIRLSPPDMPSKMADDFRNSVNRALDRNRMLRINTLPVDVVIDMMDAGAATYDGPIFNTFKRPVDDAYNSWTQRFDAVQREILEKKRELGIDMMASRRIGVYAADQQETGREKLRNLYRSQDELMTDDQIDAEIDAIIGRMRPEDFEFYAFLRERLDAVRPELRTLMRDLFNEDLAVVDNYFPFRTDYEVMQSDILGERISDSVGWKKLPETGMLQKRRGAGRQAIKVDAIQIYLDHMKDVTYLLEMGPHTKYMRELLEREDVKTAVGDVGYTFLRDWIDTISRMGGVDSSMRIPWLDAMRRNVGVGILGLKVTTALLNITPVINAVPMVGPGTFHNLGTLLVSREWRKFLVDNMPEIANRVGNDPQFVELYGSGSWDSIRNKIATVGFYPIQRMDLWAAASVGVTAYKKYLRDNNLPLDLTTPNMDAVRYAELMVRRTQSSGNFKDIPLAISRGRGITGNKSLNAAMLQFTNYTLNQWSLLTYEGASAVDSPSDAVRAFGIWMFAGASMYVAQLMRMGYYDIVSDLFGGGDDDDRTIADKLTTDGLSAIPYLSPFMGAVIYGGQMVPVFDTLVSTAGGFVQMARGILDADDERTMRGVLAAGAGLGKLAGIPGMTEVEKFGREALIPEDRRAIGNAVSELLDMESQFASRVPPARVTATARLAFNEAFNSGVIEQYDENGLPIPRKLLEQRFVQSVSARYRSRSKYE